MVTCTCKLHFFQQYIYQSLSTCENQVEIWESNVSYINNTHRIMLMALKSS